MTIALYCTCGASWTGTADTDGAASIAAEFERLHSGEGHERCDRQTAARARRAAEFGEETMKHDPEAH